MGYRSNARLLTTEKGVAEIGAYIEKHAKDEEERKIWNVKELIGRVGNKILFGWEATKFYKEYGADLLNEAMDEMTEPHNFMRFGEDKDDIEEIYSDPIEDYIAWARVFYDNETLGLKTLELDFNKEETDEIARVAKATGQSEDDVIETLKSLYRANLYEDLKDIEKGEI